MRATRRGAFSIVCCVLVVIAGCSAIDDGLGGEATTTTTAAPTSTAPPTSTGPDTYALGEAVDLEQENTTIAVQVVEYRLADSYETADGTTVEAPGDGQFLFVKVTVENVGGADGATPPVAVRPQNRTGDDDYDAASWMDEGWYYHVRPLPAGETRTGWVLVRVDGDVTASDVRIAFSPDILITQDEYRWTLAEE